MNIGNTVKHRTVVPLKHPIQQPEPVQNPVPKREPVREPEKVDA